MVWTPYWTGHHGIVKWCGHPIGRATMESSNGVDTLLDGPPCSYGTVFQTRVASHVVGICICMFITYVYV